MTRPTPRAFIAVLAVAGALAGCGHPTRSYLKTGADSSAAPLGPAASASPSPDPDGSTPVLPPPTANPPTPSRTRSAPKTPPKTPARANPGTGDRAGADAVAQAVLDQTNAWRAAAGLHPYKMARGLAASAHKHNLAMAAGCGLSHRCAGEADLGDRIHAQGVQWSGAGENCGVGGGVANTTAAITASAKGLNQAMFNEKPPGDGHRRNLLSSGFTQIGIDVVRDGKGSVWLTEDFVS